MEVEFQCKERSDCGLQEHLCVSAVCVCVYVNASLCICVGIYVCVHMHIKLQCGVCSWKPELSCSGSDLGK